MHFLNSGRMALQARAPRQEPKQRNATLTWFDIQNIQTATCWAGGFTHRGKFKMLVYVGQNSRLFSLLQMKRIKSENGRTFLQVFTGCSESVPGCQTWQLSVYRPSMRKNTVYYCITEPPPSTWRVKAPGSRLEDRDRFPQQQLPSRRLKLMLARKPRAQRTMSDCRKSMGKKKKKKKSDLC